MSITDKLRKKVRGYGRYVYTTPQADCLTAIAVRIDEKVADMQAFCDRLREAAEGREDVTLWGVDYIALPEDAEGVPICVGDVLMAGEYGGKVITCTGYCYQTEGYDEPHWSIAFEYDGRSGTTEFASARHCHHYYPPTVEDVLMEFHERMDELGTTDQCAGIDRADAVDALLRERAELVAEYAKRLRLAGDVE